jgi:hypothetical protein
MGSESLAKADACSERVRLLAVLEEAAESYAVLASSLGKQIGVLTKEEYESLRSRVESARLRAEAVRNAYFAHREKHGC